MVFKGVGQVFRVRGFPTDSVLSTLKDSDADGVHADALFSDNLG